jgi:hypothetical protein
VKFLLVHSPALGPSSWRWVANALRQVGHEPIVPDLTAQATGGDAVGFAVAAARAARGESSDDGSCVVAGHSGAGALLPLIGAQCSLSAHLVFVDAVVPPCAGEFSAGGDFVETLDRLSTDGVLPIWPEWWGPGVLDALVPDGEQRRTIAAELPRVPLSFYETPLVAPLDWCEDAASYVLLSDSYRPEAERARALGWRVTDLAGGHLDIVRRPRRTVEALLDSIDAPPDS